MRPIYYSCRKTHHPSNRWIAWCGLKRLLTDGPLFEPQKDIWFQIGESEEDALAQLKKEVLDVFPNGKWIRQETP